MTPADSLIELEAEWFSDTTGYTDITFIIAFIWQQYDCLNEGRLFQVGANIDRIDISLYYSPCYFTMF